MSIVVKRSLVSAAAEVWFKIRTNFSLDNVGSVYDYATSH